MPAPVKTFADYFFFGGNDAASETDPSLRAMPNGRLALIWSDDVSGTNPEIAFASLVAGNTGFSTTTFLNGATDEFNITQAFTAGGFRIVA